MSRADAINEAAAIWLLRLEASPSAELLEHLQEWLDAEPRHRAAYLRLRFAWYISETFRLARARCRGNRATNEFVTR